MPIHKTVILLGYYASERPGMPDLFRPDGSLITSQYGDWDHVMWGEPGRPGRIPTAIFTAQQFDAAKLIYVGGGARFASGQTEPDWVRQYIRENTPRLARDFPMQFHSWSHSESHDWLDGIWDVEHGGHNTATSLMAVAPGIVQRAGGMNFTVFVVTSANHIQRSLKDAILAFDECKGVSWDRGMIHAVPAKTAYGGGSVVDVKVDDLGKGQFNHWVAKT
jgi:hypothetical protein